MNKIADLIGTVVIVRTREAGVHAGKLLAVDGPVVTLANARRMWRWWAKESISLSGVARHGLADRSEVRIAGELPLTVINGWCELLPCTEAAAASIASAPEARTS